MGVVAIVNMTAASGVWLFVTAVVLFRNVTFVDTDILLAQFVKKPVGVHFLLAHPVRLV